MAIAPAEFLKPLLKYGDALPNIGIAFSDRYLRAKSGLGPDNEVSILEFLANREICREFCNFGPDRGSEVAIRPMIQRT
jgi:hypothetical protein